MAQKSICSDSKVWSVTDPPKDIYKEFHVIMNVSVQMTEKRMKKIQKNRRKTGADYEKAAGFYLEQMGYRFFSLITAAVLGRSI